MRRPLLLVCTCLFISIALWTQLKMPLPKAVEAADWEGKTVLLIGQVYDKEFRTSYGEETLVLYLKSILYSTEAEASYSQIKQASWKLSDIISTDNLICEISLKQIQETGIPELGSEVFLKGKWQNINPATNPGEFDAANYYMILGIGARIKSAQLLGIGTTSWYVREMLYRLREQWQDNLYIGFGNKEAALLAKMLLGVGNGLDEEIRDLYQNNGIVHILSISGLHISLLGMGVYKGLRRMGIPMKLAAVAGGVIIIGYGVMTGFGISASRAVGMYLIHMLGECCGKTYDMLTAMGVLLLGLQLQNPYVAYHSGFLLSFSSVAGVGMLSELLQSPVMLFRRIPGERKGISYCKKILQKMSSGLQVSLSVTIFTLPIQLYFFYKIPIYSVFVNLLVIPFMSIVMLVGLLVMVMPIFGFLSPVEAGIFGWFEWLCHSFEALPGHTLLIGRPDMWKILFYYILLMSIIFLGKRVRRILRLFGVAGLVIFITLRYEEGLQITMLDVGQGDCICVDNGQVFLFDGGSSSRQNVGEKVILPFLQHEGIDEIEGIFLSHADIDHSSGILQLLNSDEVRIHKIYLPDVSEGNRQEYETIQMAAKNIPIQYVSRGDRWELGDMVLTCLHPKSKDTQEGNAHSACYLLQKDTFSMLFTGDVEGEGEERLTEELVRRGIKQVDVLKVAHHGSRYSTTESFLEVLDIKNALISCGRNNSYGHPHKETVERLKGERCMVLMTSEQGAISIVVDKDAEISGYIE